MEQTKQDAQATEPVSWDELEAVRNETLERLTSGFNLLSKRITNLHQKIQELSEGYQYHLRDCKDHWNKE